MLEDHQIRTIGQVQHILTELGYVHLLDKVIANPFAQQGIETHVLAVTMWDSIDKEPIVGTSVENSLEAYKNCLHQARSYLLPPGKVKMPSSMEEAKAMWLIGEDYMKGNHADQLTPVQFPIMLRKMWSGTEVQQWLDENVNKGIV